MHVTMSRAWIVLTAICWQCLGSVGDPCPTRAYRSSCQPAEECTTLKEFIESGQLKPQEIQNCGFSTWGEKICCPFSQTTNTSMRFSPDDTTRRTTTTTTTTTTTRTTTTTTTTTTTASPPWLSIFATNREYVQRSVAITVPFGPDAIIFPGTSTEHGAGCQTPLYEGKCMPTSSCPSLQMLLDQQRLGDDDVQTCRGGTTEEIICCPINVPLQPRGQLSTDTRVGGLDSEEVSSVPLNVDVTEQATAQAVKLLPQYTHLAALAYPNAAFDGYVHRCTAVTLTQQLLLTAAGCGERPSHAVFGVADLRDVDEDEDYLVDIKHVAQHRKDLALLRLAKPLRLGQDSVANTSLAPMCSQFELTRLQVSGQLIATGWAKGNGSDCPLYELPMRLLPTAVCSDIPNTAKVDNLPSTHLCLGPRDRDALNATDSSSSSSSSCAPCPAAVGSVLHLLRPSGQRCVVGIATPTGATCTAQEMYFTSILDAQLQQFVRQQQQLQQQQQQKQ